MLAVLLTLPYASCLAFCHVGTPPKYYFHPSQHPACSQQSMCRELWVTSFGCTQSMVLAVCWSPDGSVPISIYCTSPFAPSPVPPLHASALARLLLCHGHLAFMACDRALARHASCFAMDALRSWRAIVHLRSARPCAHQGFTHLGLALSVCCHMPMLL